ncbi:hypothetical protein V6N13_100468 [Hibiscus sabdariffa]|uniref:Uncharacterized protein n=2 Tax=Hibiscus sabdariffa TaxID=183260 RepID=A0ABR2PD30_9ROSI
MRRMASSITARGIDATVGVGPKLGRFIAHKFAHERYIVAILARDLGRLSRFADEITREEKSVQCILPAGFLEPTSFTDIKIDSLEKSLAISFLDAFLCTQQVQVQLSFQPSKNKYPFTLSTFLSYGIESMEGAFWDGEKAKRNDSFHWLITFALWHR